MAKIHIYHGDGKGKTTAASGLSLRALGSGFKVIFVQFLKFGISGEVEFLRKQEGVTIIRSAEKTKFSFQMNEQEKKEALVRHMKLFEKAINLPLDEKTLLVFDEVIGSIAVGLLDEKAVLDFLQSKPKAEIVLTGRDPSDKLLEVADYVSEIKKIKHPFEKGLEARKGIEF